MSAPIITLHEQREIFKRATTPGRAERLWLTATFGTLAVAVGLAVLAFVTADARFAWAAVIVALMAVGLATEWALPLRRRRLQMRQTIERNRPAAVRLALYVLQPQFEDIDVLAGSGVIEVLADPFTLNAAERDFEFEARLDDARVGYERVDECTAHLRDQHAVRGLGDVPAAQ